MVFFILENNMYIHDYVTDYVTVFGTLSDFVPRDLREFSSRCSPSKCCFTIRRLAICYHDDFYISSMNDNADFDFEGN